MSVTANKTQTVAKATGRAKGGMARAASLSSDERSLIAKRAAVARWGEKPPQATHKGNFKDEFEIDVECYVLNDAQKTAVISQTGMAMALGLSSRGNAFPRFADGKVMAGYLGAELLEKIENPLKFQWGSGGAEIPPSLVNGYDVTLLIDVCKAILKADEDGALAKNQSHLAVNARVILNASAKAGIKGLVYALAGYDAKREEVISAFKQFVQDEAKEYEKEFPPQLYSEWYRLYKLPKFGRGRPWEFKTLTMDHVYFPLARSNGKLRDMLVASKVKSGDRTKKLHQFLSEVGTRALRTHLGQLLGIARISKNRSEYERHVSTLFGDQVELDLED
ncbi:P63C domain-containing protein [Burkholderia multivorans]|uniref:P63C domain-containing protein n=1 Tax=Burkholderia multivorans TaxID=87883 RepID=UPI0005BCB192|nr:P63C domain-containing protein [Burkholderia multivorans]MBU9472689.1 P63C domain-containing protein [Burkholderia multivorans]MDN8007382.1 P63C domain-containing protein [Burkholderia multivorans]